MAHVAVVGTGYVGSVTAANLKVTGTAADPVILGRITLNNGELFFQGKRFEIQSGTIVFAASDAPAAAALIPKNSRRE